jgi:hypothetical protein
MKSLPKATVVALFFSMIAPASNAQSGWVNFAIWDVSAGYKECSGPFCSVYSKIYTDQNTASVGDPLSVFNSITGEVVARFEVKGIYYKQSEETCWISAKPGKKPDTYLTAFDCRVR